MSFANFFNKETVAYPSGARAAEEGFKNSKYQNALLSMGKVIAGVAAASAMVACDPSPKQIEEMKQQVPEKVRAEMTAAYDSTLLAKIDSLHNIGMKMENAVEKGVLLTWDQARNTMPKRRAWTGKEYILKDHAQRRTEDSRDAKTTSVMRQMVVSNGKTTRIAMRPQVITTYDYKAEFRNQLAKEIQQNKAAQTAQTLQTLKSVQKAGR